MCAWVCILEGIEELARESRREVLKEGKIGKIYIERQANDSWKIDGIPRKQK